MSAAPALLPNIESGLSPDGLGAVHDMILDSLRKTSLGPVIDELSGAIGGGKMLRARLTLKIGSATDAPRDTLLRAAAAVEMIHAASLLHDDVIDGGLLRRGVSSFWRKKSVSGAILLGDLMVCKAVQMLEGIENGRLGSMLVRLAGEMCDAEAEQELVTYRHAQDPGFAGGRAGTRREKCVSVARRKTGSLFAFAAAAAATDGSDEERAEALLEAGYRIGTAYQMADDLMDACGAPMRDGKDLGKDARNGKLTSVSALRRTDRLVLQSIRDLREDSLRLLISWPALQDAWRAYLTNDFDPVIDLFAGKYSGASPS